MAKCIFTIYYANFTLCSVEYTLYSVVKLQKKNAFYSARHLFFILSFFMLFYLRSPLYSVNQFFCSVVYGSLYSVHLTLYMQFLYQYDDEARFGKSRGELATINDPGYNNNHRLVSLNLGSHTYIFQ